MSAPDLDEKSYFKSDIEDLDDEPILDFSAVDEDLAPDLDLNLDNEEVEMPSEEQLLMEAISAIESEVEEIKESESEPSPIAGLGFDDESDLPEWLPPAAESPYSEPELPPSTTDLPDWLRKPDAEEVADPAALGFSEATVEEVVSLSAEELNSSPSDELDEIISQHTAEELEDLSTENSAETGAETEAPSLETILPIEDSFNDDLAQFDWDDIDNDNSPVTEFDLTQTPDDDSGNSMFDSDPSDLLDELMHDASESTAEASADEDLLFEDEDELDEGSDFDWLDGESIDNGFLDDDDFSGLVAEEPLSELDAEEPAQIDNQLESVASVVDELDKLEIKEEAQELEVPEPELDLLNEPEISLPDLLLDADLETPVIDDVVESLEPVLEEGIVEEDVEDVMEESSSPELIVEQAEEDVDMSAWDEMEDAFSPLKEFDDETDVFSTIRDTPRIEETISAESLAGYISKPDWEIEPGADEESLESSDDFLSTFAEEAGDEVELPSWANELSSTAKPDASAEAVSGRSPLFGIDNIVDVAPVIANPVQDLANLHAPQMMEPVAHRKRAHLAAQAAGTVPMSDPTQPVVVPKARQRYQPRFNPNQFDGRPNQQKKKRSRQIGFIVVAAVIALMIGIAFASSYILSFFSG